MSNNENIVRLVPRTARSDEAIELLKEFVARLESGDIEAVAIAAKGRGAELHTAWWGWSGDLIAPNELLAARLMTDLRQRAE